MANKTPLETVYSELLKRDAYLKSDEAVDMFHGSNERVSRQLELAAIIILVQDILLATMPHTPTPFSEN